MVERTPILLIWKIPRALLIPPQTQLLESAEPVSPVATGTRQIWYCGCSCFSPRHSWRSFHQAQILRAGFETRQWLVQTRNIDSKLSSQDSYRDQSAKMASDFNMMTSSNGNIFRVTGPLCGKSPVTIVFPAQRPVTRSFDISFDLQNSEWMFEQAIMKLLIWDTITLIMTSP